MNPKFEKGFTLIELLVVIAIVAILGVVAITAIDPVKRINDAKDNQALANVQQIAKSFESCMTDKLIDTTPTLTQAAAITACCTTATAGNCTSSPTTGLGAAGFGYGSGFPTGVGLLVNRSTAAGTPPTASICISQPNSAGTYVRYVVGGGTINKAGAICVNGV